MNNKYLRSGHQRNLFPLIPIIAGIAYFLTPSIPEARFNCEYRKAEPYAIRQFGDHQAPLTDAERDEWYQSLGIKNGERPSLNQLKDFYTQASTRPYN